MARLARVVAAGVPHLVTQRGNRGQPVFFLDSDYALYTELLAEGCRVAGTQVWAYCLLPDRVHLILLPRDADGLRAALGETHRRYTRQINLRQGWRGFLWQGRFASFPVETAALAECARYVEQAAVRAKLAHRARDWRWSSANPHLRGRDDSLVRVKPLLERTPEWAAFLRGAQPAQIRATIESRERTGRPLGSPRFVAKLEQKLGRTLARQKPGPKPKRKKKRKQ